MGRWGNRYNKGGGGGGWRGGGGGRRNNHYRWYSKSESSKKPKKIGAWRSSANYMPNLDEPIQFLGMSQGPRPITIHTPQNNMRIAAEVEIETTNPLLLDGDDVELNHEVLIGTVRGDVVGLRYYGGTVSTKEMVSLVREPDNQYDCNAVRVLNVMGEQVGHIKRGLAVALAWVMDNDKARVEGLVPQAKNNSFSMPIDITLWGDAVSKNLVIEHMGRYGIVVKPAGEDMYRVAPSQATPGAPGPSHMMSVRRQLTTNEMKDQLDGLFSSLEEVDKTKTMDPVKAVKTSLFPHQKQALSWMTEKENSNNLPPFWKKVNSGIYFNSLTNFTTRDRPDAITGGILADDMGLGKTLAVISLILTNFVDKKPLAVPVPGCTRASKMAKEHRMKVYRKALNEDLVQNRKSFGNGSLNKNVFKKNSCAEEDEQHASNILVTRKGKGKLVFSKCTPAEVYLNDSDSSITDDDIEDECDDDDEDGEEGDVMVQEEDPDYRPGNPSEQEPETSENSPTSRRVSRGKNKVKSYTEYFDDGASDSSGNDDYVLPQVDGAFDDPPAQSSGRPRRNAKKPKRYESSDDENPPPPKKRAKRGVKPVPLQGPEQIPEITRTSESEKPVKGTTAKNGNDRVKGINVPLHSVENKSLKFENHIPANSGDLIGSTANVGSTGGAQSFSSTPQASASSNAIAKEKKQLVPGASAILRTYAEREKLAVVPYVGSELVQIINMLTEKENKSKAEMESRVETTTKVQERHADKPATSTSTFIGDVVSKDLPALPTICIDSDDDLPDLPSVSQETFDCKPSASGHPPIPNNGRTITHGPRATLIICPLSVLNNWIEQIEEHVDPSVLLETYTYYGPSRTRKANELADKDIVFTTYATVVSDSKGKNTIGKVEWLRLVLDEGHTIRNPNALQTKAILALKAQRKWVLTGTPIQNSMKDLYSIISFLGIKPLDTMELWNRIIQRPISHGSEDAFRRVQKLMRTIALRRMKSQEMDGKPIVSLPTKSVFVETLTLTDEERKTYDAMAKEGRLIVSSYFRQGTLLHHYGEVLAILMRLRQLCCHPLLVARAAKAMHEFLETAEKSVSASTPDELRKTLIAKVMEVLKSGSDEECSICLESLRAPVVTHCAHLFCKPCIEQYIQSTQGEALCPLCRAPVVADQLVEVPANVQEEEDIVCETWQPSTKVDALLRGLIALRKEDPTIKSLVVSQFTSFLSLIEKPLIENGFRFVRLDGTMSSKQRIASIETFSDKNPSSPTIFLLSLKAGGVGLNLVAASRVFLMDPAWNPASEEQCFDRCYRLGQTREVIVTKYVIDDSVEGRMLELQEKKRNLMNGAFAQKQTAEEKRQNRINELRTLMDI